MIQNYLTHSRRLAAAVSFTAISLMTAQVAQASGSSMPWQ